MNRGFVIRSAPDPSYVKWDDDSRIPFELRFKGRIQLDNYFYKVTDHTNHQTNLQYATAPGDFDQLEVKRLRLIWEGTAFDPDFRYHFELDGNTRGLGGTLNTKLVQTTGNSPGGAGAAVTPPTGGAGGTIVPVGGGVTVDHAVRLFSAYIAYDFHGCASEKGCGEDCAEGTYKYAPTYTAIVGKMKPFFCIEEVLGSANEQFVEYSMADWYFDADDDNLLMGAGVQVKAFEDRLFFQAILTNGNESQFPNTQMDDYPGFNAGFWYDIGGSWNRARNKWDLFGDSLSDVDYSCKPVFRIGAECDIVPMDRASLYGDLEQSRVFVMPAGPGGTRLINLLSAPGLTGVNGSAHALDEFDYYTYGAFICGKYRGFSFMNEWYLRDLNNFDTTPNGGGNIVYSTTFPTTGAHAFPTANAIFPKKALIDYGSTLQCGYFLVPKKLEVCARWAWINGESGDINGLGKAAVGTIPSTPTPGTTVVLQVPGAFNQRHMANEYAVGVNYYFRRQLLKWQTDLGWYEGGNPAANGSSPAGWVAGVDGWMIRTQLQFAF
jgi:hypothetical protein